LYASNTHQLFWRSETSGGQACINIYAWEGKERYLYMAGIVDNIVKGQYLIEVIDQRKGFWQ